jgi:hypothetical protein
MMISGAMSRDGDLAPIHACARLGHYHARVKAAT